MIMKETKKTKGPRKFENNLSQLEKNKLDFSSLK